MAKLGKVDNQVVRNPKVSEEARMTFSVGAPQSLEVKDEGMVSKYCARCGKNLTDPDTGASFIGVSFILIIDTPGGYSEKFYRKQFGVYLPSDKNHVEYNICWECWMNSLGIKPKKDE